MNRPYWLVEPEQPQTVAIGTPFSTEAWDRLQEAQARGAIVPNPKAEAVANALVTPINDGAALRSARGEMTQAALADALGLAAPQISLMENGKAVIDPRTDLAVRALLARRALG